MAFDSFSNAAGFSPIPGVTIPRIENFGQTRAMQSMGELLRMRRMEYLAQPRGPMGTRGGMGTPGMPDMSTGMDPSLMDPSVVNPLLAAFGQQMPQNPRTNAILPSTGFFGNHPHLSGAIEGALLGAANTPGGTQTIGEGISNAIRGGLSAVPERSRIINQQFQQPFQQAQVVAGLQKDLYSNEAEIQRARLSKSQADYYDQRGDIEQAKIEEQRRALESKETIANLRAQTSAAATAEKLQAAQLAQANKFGGVEPAMHSYLLAIGADPGKAPTQAQMTKALAMRAKEKEQQLSISPTINADSRESMEKLRLQATQHARDYADLRIKPDMDPAKLATMFGGKLPKTGEVAQHNADVDAWDRDYTQRLVMGGSPPDFDTWKSQQKGTGSPLPTSVNAPPNPSRSVKSTAPPANPYPRQ